MKITLCLLTWNELAGCQADVPRLPLAAFDEIYALDGGSRDGTVEYLTALGITVHPQHNRGYNNAYREALSHCTSEALVIYHPKGSIAPVELLKFRPLLEQGYDLVVASRIIPGSINEEDSKFLRPRKWFVIFLGLLAATIWRKGGNTIYDVLHGMRGLKMSAVEVIDLLTTGVSADLEMVVRSYKHNLKIIEFPVAEKTRLAGETHFRAFSTGKALLAYLWFELFRRPSLPRPPPPPVSVPR